MDPYLIRGLRGLRADRLAFLEDFLDARRLFFEARGTFALRTTRRVVRRRLGALGVFALRAALRVTFRLDTRLAARGTLAARRRVTRLVDRRLTAIFVGYNFRSIFK